MTAPAEQNQEVKTASEQVPAQKTNDKEYNFAQIRKQLEQERAEKLQWKTKAEEAEKAKAKINAQDDDDFSDEPYVDEKRLQKKLAKFEERFVQKVDEQAEAKARALIEQERQSAFLKANPDFHEILKEDVIQKFAEKHPDIAEPMLEMPNNFARQKLLYQNIKALGVNKPAQPAPTIQETIDKNRRSPFYQPSGVAAAPYAANGDFSDTGQKAAFQKMKELQKRLRI
jgi:hypothetical protein